MKKTTTRLLLTFALILVFATLMAVAAFAATPGTGYCVDGGNNQTNIKWTMDESGVLTFEIDASATDKVQTTVLSNKDPVTGSGSSWNKCLPTFADVVKIVIGDGITEIAGFSALQKLKQVEIPTSLVRLIGPTFECSPNLQSVYIRGTEAVAGLFDFSNITYFEAYCCDGTYNLTKLKLNPNYSGSIFAEAFRGSSLTEVEIPAGVVSVNNNAFMENHGLKVMTILGMETTLQSDDVFMNNNAYPAIKAKAGSKAAEFAKANGYTFIDLDSGETTKGSKPTTGDPTSGGSGGSAAVTEFNPEGATLWGHSTGKYNGTDIINTYWAYYQETKTLEFVSASGGYNETGSMSNVDKEYTHWGEYKDEIEHVIVGDGIDKISTGAFMDHTALKDVRMGKNLNQIDPDAFTGCTSLTTIWRNGTERIEGRADLSKVQKVSDAYRKTAISEIVLPNTTKELTVDIATSVKTIYVYDITEALIEYARNNLFNLQSTKNPNDRYEFWVYVDHSLPACGARSVYGFDEATGTLTVYGAGKIDDVINYYGGGSKNRPWNAIRNDVKHVVISENITSIGKYAFCEFVNLETVQLPTGDIEILNGAFEKCHSLKSVYKAGTEPIEGTADLSSVYEMKAWCFAYDWLIANIIVSPRIEKISSSVFEENVNLANVYGEPGSYAETYATENGKTFYDASANTPQPITCTPPETTEAETETEAPETTLAPETTADPETETETNAPETKPVSGNVSSANVLPIIIAVVVAVVVAAAVVVVVIVAKKKKSAK